MGLKFYRGSDKSRKIQKRLWNTRTWARSFKWVSYHAHPTFVQGHPFKGGQVYSTGYLRNPEMKRFGLTLPVLFKPPHPAKSPRASVVYAAGGAVVAAEAVPNFGDFFASYFGSTSYKLNDTCAKLMSNMKNCYNNNSNNPVAQCSYYIDGFSRFNCSN